MSSTGSVDTCPCDLAIEWPSQDESSDEESSAPVASGSSAPVTSVGCQTDDPPQETSIISRGSDPQWRRCHREMEDLLWDLNLFPVRSDSGFEEFVKHIYHSVGLDDNWRAARKAATVVWPMMSEDYQARFRFEALKKFESRILEKSRRARVLLNYLRE